MSGAVDNKKELEELRRQRPDMMVLGQDSGCEEVGDYLKSKGYCGKDDVVVGLEPAGEVFNMNCTIRVKMGSGGSVVVKQSRPFAERFPQVEAPIERVNAEAAFYSLIHKDEALCGMAPRLVGHDPVSYILVMSDLGKAGDWGKLYEGAGIPVEVVEKLAKWLATLHTMPCTKQDREMIGENTGMKQLTANYVFTLPMEVGGGGIDLNTVSPGLEKIAKTYREDAAYKAHVTELLAIYMNPREGRCLIHGDFFPASWMDITPTPCVIDSEFAHFGVAEFDLGVALAHFILTNNHSMAKVFYKAYAMSRPTVDACLAAQFAGVEMMRRTIGLAQLPFPPSSPLATLTHKEQVMKTSRLFVVSPEEGRGVFI